MILPRLRRFCFLLFLVLVWALAPSHTVFGLPGSEIAVTPGSVRNVPPTNFTVAITLANVSSLIGFDVQVRYNQTLLNALHVGAGNVFACVAASPPCGSSIVTLANSTAQSTGTIDFAQAILSCTTCPGYAIVGNATLFTIKFAFQNYGSSPITISIVSLTGLVNGFVIVLPSPVVVNGFAVTPPAASATLVKSGTKVVFHHLSLSKDGDIQTIIADVANTGATVAFVKLVYIIASAAGNTAVVSSVIVQIPIGGTSLVSTSYTVPLLPVRYFVLVSLLVSGDGSLFVLTSSTDALSYNVVL